MIKNTMTTKQRGCLIVFEGCDKSGKTFMCNYLKTKLVNHKVEFLNFPDRTTNSGSLINKHLKEKGIENTQQLHLLFLINRWEKQHHIINLLNNGTHVIIDRYVHSGIAYSLANDLDPEWCNNLNMGLVKPDAVIFLNDELNYKHLDFGHELFETVKFQQKVLHHYKKMFDSSWTSIDVSSNFFSTIKNAIVTHVIKEFNFERGPIKYF